MGAGLEALDASAGLRLKASASLRGRGQCILSPRTCSKATRPSPEASPTNATPVQGLCPGVVFWLASG